MNTMISFGSILYNEEKMICGLISNIYQYCDKYCDELIIIDQKSTDKTIELIKNLGFDEFNKIGNLSLIIKQTTNKKYADPDRTWLLSMPKKNDWIFMIDADERLPKDIPFDDIIKQGYDGINLPMRSLYFDEGSGYEGWDYETLKAKGKEVNEGYPDWHIRLLKKGTQWPDKVHQKPTFKKELNLPGFDMLHIKTYEKQLEKAQRYAMLQPETVQFHTRYIMYIQQQLGKEIKGL